MKLFTGATSDLHGNVFQTHSEQTKGAQFEDTMNALQTYALQKYVKQIELLAPLFTDLTMSQLVKPTPKEDKKNNDNNPRQQVYTLDAFEREEYRCEVKNHAKETAALKSTTCSLFNIVIRQCSKMMKSKLKGEESFEQVEFNGNVAELLKLIREISRQVNTNESIYDAIDEAKARYYRHRQGSNEDNEQYTRCFKTNVEVAEHQGASLFQGSQTVRT